MKFNEFIFSFFKKINNSGIKTCVLRNYENFPVKNKGNDIDFLVEKNNVPVLLEMLNDIDGILVTDVIKRKYVVSVFLWNVENNDGNALQVDFLTELSWKGNQYLEREDVFSSMVKVELSENIHFFKPALHIEAISTFFSSYIVGGWVKDRYQSKVVDVFIEKEMEIQTQLEKKYGSSNTKKLIELVQCDDRKGLLSFRKIFIKGFIRNSIKVQGIVKFTFNTIKHFAYEVIIRLNPKTRFNLCILGPDGVGKSTIINNIQTQLHLTVKCIDYVHLKPRIINRLNKGNQTEGQICVDPHGTPPRNNILSIIKILIWVGETWIDRIFNRPKNSTLRIWDRYFYDIYVDPKRYRYGASVSIARFLGRLVPTPNMIIVLSAPAEVIHARKQEVSIEETKWQVKEYEIFYKTHGAKVISTDCDVEIASQNVLNAVLNKLASRDLYNG